MLFRLITCLSLCLVFVFHAQGQEQVSFFEDFRSNGMEYSHYWEVDGEYRILVRHVNGDVNILNLKEDRSMDTLFSANYTTESQAYKQTAFENYYYEVFNEKIIRLNIETLEEEVIDSDPAFHNKTSFGSIPGLINRQDELTSYILNTDTQVKTVDRRLSQLRELANQFILGITNKDTGGKDLELIDLVSTDITLVGSYADIRFYPTTPKGVILSTDDFSVISYYDETLQEIIPFYDLPLGNSIKHVNWSNDHLIVLSDQDTIETLAVFDNTLSLVNEWEITEPANFSNWIVNTVLIAPDSVLINYSGKTLGLAKGGDSQLEILEERVLSDQIMSNDSIVAFIESSVLYQLDFETLEFEARDSIEYANKTSFSSGYHNHDDYILTDGSFYFRVYDELYVSNGIQEMASPICLFEGNIISTRLHSTEDLFKACGTVAIKKSDSLYCFDGTKMLSVATQGVFRNVVTMDDDAYYLILDDNNDRLFIQLTYDGTDFIETELDNLSSVWHYGKSRNGNYLVFINSQDQVFVRRKGDPAITQVGSIPDGLLLEDAYYGNSVILRKSGNPDSIYSYNITSQELQSLGASAYTFYGHLGEGGIIMTSDGADRNYFRYNKTIEKFESIDFGLPSDFYITEIYPCENKFAAIVSSFSNSSFYAILDPEMETAVELTQTADFHSDIITLDSEMYFTTTYNDYSTDINRINCQEENFEVIHAGVNDLFINAFKVNDARFGHFFNYAEDEIYLASIDADFNYERIVAYPDPSINQDLYLNPLVSSYENIPMVIADKAIVNMNPDNLGNELYQVYEDGSYELLFDLFEGPLSSEILTIRMDGKKNMLYHDGHIYFTGRTYENGRQVYRFEQENVISTDVVDIKLDDKALRFFPNPATEAMTIENDELHLGNNRYSIFTVHGQEIQKGYLDQGRLNVSSLVPGVYGLQIAIDQELYTIKFIKQ